jgi:hypothetical protein
VRSPDELAANVVSAWARLYTSGLEPAVRDPRREEIDSDLWEHAHAGRRAGAEPRSVAGQMLARCLLGIGADVSWRAHMSVHASREREGVQMREHIRRNWWLPIPFAMIALGVFMVFTHVVGDGAESWWSRTDSGWNPSTLERAGAVLALGSFFVVVPAWAVAVRRTHPGWTFVLLLPWVAICLTPLSWEDAGWLLLLPLLGIAALVGAFWNLAQHSVRKDLDTRAAAGG